MKRFFILLMLLCWGINFYSQNKPGGIFNHVIEVETYSDWEEDYLTVIDPKYCSDGKTLFPTTFQPVAKETAYFPGCGDVILELNGISAKNMSPREFYSRVDTATTFLLKILNPSGEIFEQKYAVLYNSHRYMELYPEFGNYMLVNPTNLSSLGERNSLPNNPFQSISNKHYDFSKAQTYDYIIVGNDPLNDEKILDGIGKFHMKRDSKNPDILFTIAKNADEQISATYVPPTSRIINTGSTTTPNYSYLTKTYSYTTKQNYQTIHEGGYTETTKTTDIFLELAALDAKKINDKSISYAPIIWQMTASEYLLNATMKNLEKYLIYASWAYMPPIDRAARKEQVLWEVTGLVPDKENPALVAEVREGSRAEKAGFQVGDIISKIECSYNSTPVYDRNGIKTWWYYENTITSKHIKRKSQLCGYSFHISPTNSTHDMKKGMIECLNSNMNISWKTEAELLTHNVAITVIRNKKKIKLYMQPRSTKFTRYYWLNNAQLESVQK